MSLQSARSAAEKLAAAHSNEILPIRPEIIARSMGIACITEHLDSEIDGLLIVKDLSLIHI